MFDRDWDGVWSRRVVSVAFRLGALIDVEINLSDRSCLANPSVARGHHARRKLWCLSTAQCGINDVIRTFQRRSLLPALCGDDSGRWPDVTTEVACMNGAADKNPARPSIELKGEAVSGRRYAAKCKCNGKLVRACTHDRENPSGKGGHRMPRLGRGDRISVSLTWNLTGPGRAIRVKVRRRAASDVACCGDQVRFPDCETVA